MNLVGDELTTNEKGRSPSAVFVGGLFGLCRNTSTKRPAKGRQALRRDSRVRDAHVRVALAAKRCRSRSGEAFPGCRRRASAVEEFPGFKATSMATSMGGLSQVTSPWPPMAALRSMPPTSRQPIGCATLESITMHRSPSDAASDASHPVLRFADEDSIIRWVGCWNSSAGDSRSSYRGRDRRSWS